MNGGSVDHICKKTQLNSAGRIADCAQARTAQEACLGCLSLIQQPRSGGVTIALITQANLPGGSR